MARDPDALDLVRRYHDETKHHFHRFAPSLGYLDWASQPAPFRSYDGSPRIDLIAALRDEGRAPEARPWLPAWLTADYDDLWRPGGQRTTTPGLPVVSALLRFSLGLSAWKQAGTSRWALRVNPSSGNLHPTEGYLVLGPGVGNADQPGVYHYAPDRHALEQRCLFAPSGWREVACHLPDGAFLAAVTSIHWREAWKYGERAFRYCQHDAGHALAAMRMAAALLGWRLALLPSWSHEDMAAVLGLDRDEDFGDSEREEPAWLAVVAPQWPPGSSDAEARQPADDLSCESPSLIAALRDGTWTGRATRLSSDRVPWEWIDLAASASRMPKKATPARKAERSPSLMPSRATPCAVPTAARLFLQRRSAVALDGSSPIDLERFLFMVRRVMPGPGVPWDALWWEPQVHLVIFVHRVTGLVPGIYALVRQPDALATLQAAFHGDFAWIRPDGVPSDIPLYLLAPIDARRIARQLSCAQDIASDGFFSLAMLATFDAALDLHGPWFYRHLFWETGVVGQVLYLEAEAAGARGTGIGCFFDDGVHDLLGVTGHALQSLYHFTVGRAVEDERLQTSPGYAWE